jgi:cysteine-rich repeat protein
MSRHMYCSKNNHDLIKQMFTFSLISLMSIGLSMVSGCAGVGESLSEEEEMIGQSQPSALPEEWPETSAERSEERPEGRPEERPMQMASMCGNGELERNETCDDGNTHNEDGCSNQCQIEAEVSEERPMEMPEDLVCGDGQVRDGEECDDGNTHNGDGCSADCLEEPEPEMMMTQEVPPALTEILNDIPGYAQETIGGKNGELYTVTSLEDQGIGTLRDAVERDEALWIVFDDDLNGVIRLESKLSVQSYKTIDARGHDITLQAVRDEMFDHPSQGWHNTGVTLGDQGDQSTEVRDVVFLNLSFDGQWPDRNRSGDGGDALHIHNNVHHVWVHQCTFYHWIDGAIDLRTDDDFNLRPHHITITNNHFFDIDQALVVEADKVTFARNYCDQVNSNCLKTIDEASAHMVNNVIHDWSQREIIYANSDSQLLVDHNIFKPGDDSEYAGRTRNSGTFQDVHNVRHNRGRYELNDRGRVDSSFKTESQQMYGPDRKVNCEHEPYDHNCWDMLYDQIRDEAGVQ